MDRAKQRKRRKTRRWCGCEVRGHMWEGSGQGQSLALLLPLLLEPGQATREACQSLHSPVLTRLPTPPACSHQLLVLSRFSPVKLNFHMCLVLFSLREVCGVPETERQQLQSCVPAECHLPGHGILGVSEGSADPVLIPTLHPLPPFTPSGKT